MRTQIGINYSLLFLLFRFSHAFAYGLFKAAVCGLIEPLAFELRGKVFLCDLRVWKVVSVLVSFAVPEALHERVGAFLRCKGTGKCPERAISSFTAMYAASRELDLGEVARKTTT